jgi:hypothetical protein
MTRPNRRVFLPAHEARYGFHPSASHPPASPSHVAGIEIVLAIRLFTRLLTLNLRVAAL